MLAGERLSKGSLMHKSIAVFLLAAFASASISLPAATAIAESLYSATILSDSPLGYWRLGEPAGATTAIDSSSGGHNGAYVGNVTLGIPGAIAGDPNTAANFGGTTGYVSVGAQPTFDLANNFTIEAWIQPSSFTGFQRIASTFDNSAGVAGYGFGLDGTRMVFTAFGQADYVANFTTATSQNWHQVVVTFQANNVATFYLDGQPTQSIAASAPVAAGNGPFTIGGRPPTSSSEAFSGGIDEVAVYHGSLSAAQILQHYDASRPWTDKTVAGLNTGVDASQNKLADGAGL